MRSSILCETKFLGSDRCLERNEMPQATSKPEQITFFPLSSPIDLGNALNASLGIGYRGTISAFKNLDGTDVWSVELNGPGNPQPVYASLNYVFIWHGTPGFLESLTGPRFLELYDIIGDNTATSKPFEVTYLPILTPEDMGSTIVAASNVGYSGKVWNKFVDSECKWWIELEGPNNPSPVQAALGEVYVWHPESSYLEVMTQEVFLSKYTPI